MFSTGRVPFKSFILVFPIPNVDPGPPEYDNKLTVSKDGVIP